MDSVSDMSEQERRLLLWLVDRDSSLPDTHFAMPSFQEMADDFGCEVSDTADTCRRLERRGVIEVLTALGSEKDYHVILRDGGRIAAVDLRKLPERERERAEAERREQRKKRKQWFLDKVAAPLAVGLILFWLGWVSKAACSP